LKGHLASDGNVQSHHVNSPFDLEAAALVLFEDILATMSLNRLFDDLFRGVRGAGWLPYPNQNQCDRTTNNLALHIGLRSCGSDGTTDSLAVRYSPRNGGNFGDNLCNASKSEPRSATSLLR